MNMIKNNKMLKWIENFEIKFKFLYIKKILSIIYNLQEKPKKEENKNFEDMQKLLSKLLQKIARLNEFIEKDSKNNSKKIKIDLHFPLEILKKIDDVVIEYENHLPYISKIFNSLVDPNYQINNIEYSVFNVIEKKIYNISMNPKKKIKDDLSFEFNCLSEEYRFFDCEESYLIINNEKMYIFKKIKNKELTENNIKLLYIEKKKEDKLQFAQTINNSEIINEHENEYDNENDNENDNNNDNDDENMIIENNFIISQNSYSTNYTSNYSFFRNTNNDNIIINNLRFDNDYSEDNKEILSKFGLENDFNFLNNEKIIYLFNYSDVYKCIFFVDKLVLYQKHLKHHQKLSEYKYEIFDYTSCYEIYKCETYFFFICSEKKKVIAIFNIDFDEKNIYFFNNSFWFFG